MTTLKELEDKLDELGYFATEELIYETFNALDVFSSKKTNAGQDIYAICLEGPPGAGKTEFANVYTKICNAFLDGETKMIEYQCDATTGKAELFEDINISAAISRDKDNVNIPGKIIKAIKELNEGKKVILFIDEYDKAREETDAFFLQLLQAGKINSTQHGDLEIKPEYKGNLQVIFCKNDMREELSGPLSRRIRIIRLDYMEPSIFYKVAKRNLVDNKPEPVDEGLINLVSLIYDKAYQKKEIYNRLPSCSEMMIAIEDANRLLKRANAPQNIVYQTIIKNMFKSPDDIKTFESSLSKVKNQSEGGLAALIQAMKVAKKGEKEQSINSMIAENILTDESSKLAKERNSLTTTNEEMKKLIEEYTLKFSEMEEKRKQIIEQEIKKILLENGKLVSTTKMPNTKGNFEDESSQIKRGHNIFEVSKNDWTDVASVKAEGLSHYFFIEKLIECLCITGMFIYENGILIAKDNDFSLIVINELDESGKSMYRFLLNHQVMPSTYIALIDSFIKLMRKIADSQLEVLKKAKKEKKIDITYNVDSLIYNDTPLIESSILSKVSDNIYHITFDNIYHIASDGKITSEFFDNIDELHCEDMQKVVNASNSLIEDKPKEKHI